MAHRVVSLPRTKRDDDGKPKYTPPFEFDSAAVHNAFSDAAIDVVLKFNPGALVCREAA
jgi:hypothetical protein